MSLLLLGEGVPFLHAGVELLRSKSMDRNSYNSGDWFNKLDFTYESNNWGVGLPPAPDNEASWPIMGPLLANAALQATRDDIRGASEHLVEMLRIRRSSGLFRLRTAGDIINRLTFFNTGPGQVPGLLVYSLVDSDGAVDRGQRRLVVLLNANDEPEAYTIPALAHRQLALHPVLLGSSDPVARTSRFISGTGTFKVPGRTAAVFVERRPATEQIGLALATVDQLRRAGALTSAQAVALWTPLLAAESWLGAGKTGNAAGLVAAFTMQVMALPGDAAGALLDAAQLLGASL